MGMLSNVSCEFFCIVVKDFYQTLLDVVLLTLIKRLLFLEAFNNRFWRLLLTVSGRRCINLFYGLLQFVSEGCSKTFLEDVLLIINRGCH